MGDGGWVLAGATMIRVCGVIGRGSNAVGATMLQGLRCYLPVGAMMLRVIGRGWVYGYWGKRRKVMNIKDRKKVMKKLMKRFMCEARWGKGLMRDPWLTAAYALHMTGKRKTGE
jgi:hypothetical protein